MKSNGAVRRLLKKVLGNSILNFSTNKKDGYNKVNLVNVLASEEQVVSALERMTTELNECCPPGATIDEKDGALSDIWYAAHKFEELDGSKKAAFQNFLTAIFSSDAFKKQTGSGRLNKERLMRKYDLGLNPSGKKFKEPKPMQGGQAYLSEPVPSDTLNRHETQKAGSALIPSNLSNEQGKGFLESSAHPDAFMSNQGLPIVISTPDMMTDISSAIPTGDMKYNTSIPGHRAETDMKIMKGMPTNKTQGYRSTHTYLPPVPEYATQSATRQSRDIAMAEAADSQLTTGRGNVTSSGQAQLNITSFQSTGQGTGGRTTMGGTPGTDPELPPLPSNRITTASPEKGDPNVAQVVSSSPTEPGTAPVDPGKEAATKDTGRDTGKSEGQNGFMDIDVTEQSVQQSNFMGNFQHVGSMVGKVLDKTSGAIDVVAGALKAGIGVYTNNVGSVVLGAQDIAGGITKLKGGPQYSQPDASQSSPTVPVQPSYVNSKVDAAPPTPQKAPDKTETDVATPTGENDLNAIENNYGTSKPKKKGGSKAPLRGETDEVGPESRKGRNNRNLLGFSQEQRKLTAPFSFLERYINSYHGTGYTASESRKLGPDGHKKLSEEDLAFANAELAVFANAVINARAFIMVKGHYDYHEKYSIVNSMLQAFKGSTRNKLDVKDDDFISWILGGIDNPKQGRFLTLKQSVDTYLASDEASVNEKHFFDFLTKTTDLELQHEIGNISGDEYQEKKQKLMVDLQKDYEKIQKEHKERSYPPQPTQPSATQPADDDIDRTASSLPDQPPDAPQSQQKTNLPAGNEGTNPPSQQPAQQQQPTQPVPPPTIPQDKTGQPAQAGSGVVNGMTIDTDQENGQGVGPLGSRVNNERYKQADAYLPTLRLFFQEGDANIVTRINENPYAKMLDRKEWNELSDYDWEANNERNNPLYTYNLIDEARRFSGKLAGEELMPAMASEATQESYNKYPKEMFMETKEVTQDSDSIVLDVRGGAPLRPLSADETEAGFRDVYMKAWIDIPETSGWKKFTQVQGSQMSDSQIRDPNHLHVNDAYAEADENMFIYTTDM